MRKIERVLGIVASPKHGGNTDILIEEALTGAKAMGASVEKIYLGDVEIRFCQGCERCQQTGACVFDDGLARVFEAMEASDAWILGTPVYVNAPTAQCKAFIDRWYGAGNGPFDGKRAAAIIPFAEAGEKAGKHSKDYIQSVFRWKGLVHVSTVLAPGVWAPGAVRGRDDLLERARAIGRELVQPT